jgi:Rps23 Pro-64 3,4-dihydroxylase Tpa1-like proline 4-hydroxylase
MTAAPIRLHARTDLDALARRYAERGRVHVASLLDMADAERLAAHDDLLARFAEFLTSPEMLALVRRLTGRDDIAFADGRATRYREGHFLTTHDDDVSVKHRVAAYVVGLTHAWRAEWGGRLQFLDGEGHVAKGFVPRFNALNLLAVPQPHLVSPVTALAGPLAASFSVTGWFRSAGPP